MWEKARKIIKLHEFQAKNAHFWKTVLLTFRHSYSGKILLFSQWLSSHLTCHRPFRCCLFILLLSFKTDLSFCSVLQLFNYFSQYLKCLFVFMFFVSFPSIFSHSCSLSFCAWYLMSCPDVSIKDLFAFSQMLNEYKKRFLGVLKNHHRQQQQRRPLLKFFNDHSIFISICQKCVASSFDAIAMTKTRHKTTTHSLNSFQKKSYHYHFLFRARDLLGTSKLTF